ncbi:hypothetical protein ACFXAZ_34530 [Streptomyces sp. NPDC059477]|uniref:hypothetical protein n=1 Tax=Streptomyces sp. NPDC059477 TaxID=3346847 RepID=UPI0036AA1907
MRRYPAPPVVLGLPLPPPEPPPDCQHCARMMRERAQATAERDGSRVSDLNVLIARHHLPAASLRTAP